MPCPFCESIYLMKPCESNIAIIIDKECEIFNKKFVLGMFDILREACPCIECIVKVMCLPKRLNCPDYIKFLQYIEDSKQAVVG